MAQHVNTDPPTSSPHSGASQRKKKKKGKAQRRRQRKIHRSRPPGRLISERSPKWERANDFQTSLDFLFLAKKIPQLSFFRKFSIFSKQKTKLQIQTHNFHL
jgi:hypothetical protein